MIAAGPATLSDAVTAGTLAAIVAALSPVVSTVPIVVPWPPLIAITAACGLIAFLASVALTWKLPQPTVRA